MAVAFDISSSIAMFRRPYTTTSSVSFPLPPPTVIAGLIAAIIGLGNGSHEQAFAARYWEKVKGTRIAMAIINPVSWYNATINFWNLKEPQKNVHIRVKHQFVKNPKYRIFVDGGVTGELKKHLEAGSFIYTPYLGVAYALAEVNYVGEFPLLPVESDRVYVSTIIPLPVAEGVQLDINECRGVFRDKLPFQLNSERKLCESITTLYSKSHQDKICLKTWEGLDVTRFGDECIAWFPAW